MCVQVYVCRCASGGVCVVCMWGKRDDFWLCPPPPLSSCSPPSLSLHPPSLSPSLPPPIPTGFSTAIRCSMVDSPVMSATACPSLLIFPASHWADLRVCMCVCGCVHVWVGESAVSVSECNVCDEVDAGMLEYGCEGEHLLIHHSAGKERIHHSAGKGTSSRGRRPWPVQC